jgi:hypothetical protein
LVTDQGASDKTLRDLRVPLQKCVARMQSSLIQIKLRNRSRPYDLQFQDLDVYLTSPLIALGHTILATRYWPHDRLRASEQRGPGPLAVAHVDATAAATLSAMGA